jgi:hypothetical protein
MAVVKLPYVPNPDQSQAGDYWARKGRPMLFQVLAPQTLDPLFSVLLALHINPDTFEERMAKSKTVVQTYGGFVEFVWPDELDTLSASGSTGAFFSPDTGLTVGSDSVSARTTGISSGRRGTMAWERQEDLLELFRSNGCVYNSVGQPLLRGRILLIFDRGAYIGHFSTFEVAEEEAKQFTFQLSWEFKVESALWRIPSR